jgi:putative NADPH-quinone reductase
MFGPGIALDLADPARAKPMLLHIKRITGISTYGRPRLQAIMIGDPPRRIIKRYLPWFTGGRARVRYHALYHMNTASAERRGGFLARVRREMEGF